MRLLRSLAPPSIKPALSRCPPVFIQSTNGKTRCARDPGIPMARFPRPCHWDPTWSSEPTGHLLSSGEPPREVTAPGPHSKSVGCRATTLATARHRKGGPSSSSRKATCLRQEEEKPQRPAGGSGDSPHRKVLRVPQSSTQPQQQASRTSGGCSTSPATNL